MLELSRENQIIDLPDLNRFQIGDHVVVDPSADNDRFEGIIIGIELRRMYGSSCLKPSITLLHDGCITDEFRPMDCRKVDPPSPQPNVAVEERSRMQLTPGYWNSFETVISALEKGGQDAQAAGFIAHGACLLHAAVELRHVWTERTKAPEELLEVTERKAAANVACDGGASPTIISNCVHGSVCLDVVAEDPREQRGPNDADNDDSFRHVHNAAPVELTPSHVRNFIGKVQGVCLGVAMSGSDHPNPDGALMELVEEAQEILFPATTEGSEG